jgi:UDP-2,4-diacetamido-2,4,6-trideoxy-beta-L-altropyranose hydrolase
MSGSKTDGMLILLRFDADATVGMGHLSRCLSLSGCLRDQGHTPILAVKRAHRSVLDRLESEEHEHWKIPCDFTWETEADFVGRYLDGRKLTATVFDITTQYALSCPNDVSGALERYRTFGKTCLIDSLGDQALAPRLSEPVDLQIVPYVCGASEVEPVETVSQVLAGPEFFILDASYRESGLDGARCYRRNANRLLVTFGGSDPTGLTLQAMQAIALIPDRWEIRVIVGPGFSDQLQSDIRICASTSRHACELVLSPKSLFEHMWWADLALSSSGLTKYELAFSGTPALLISIDEAHAQVHSAFGMRGTSDHLGVGGDVPPEDVATHLQTLMGDRPRREIMGRVGSELVDGKGARRCVDALAGCCG